MNNFPNMVLAPDRKIALCIFEICFLFEDNLNFTLNNRMLRFGKLQKRSLYEKRSAFILMEDIFVKTTREKLASIVLH
jgi:hypothetical protein